MDRSRHLRPRRNQPEVRSLTPSTELNRSHRRKRDSETNCGQARIKRPARSLIGRDRNKREEANGLETGYLEKINISKKKAKEGG